MSPNRPTPRRLRATAWHLLISAAVAALAATLVFGLWYPRPFDAIAGGMSLFALLMVVDLVIGPALTAVVAAPAKPLGELARDLSIIGLLQASALAYGMWTIASARPVVIAFEIDRLRVVSAADIDPELLTQAPEPWRSLSWMGPVAVSAARPDSAQAQLESIDLGLAGIDLAMVPASWRSYDDAQRAQAWNAARPLEHLLRRHPQAAAAVQALVERHGNRALRYLPLQARRAEGVAVIGQPEAEMLAFLPYDGFP